MSWERGQRYRGKAVTGQFQIEKNDKTGTMSAVGLLEVTLGPQLGQRIRWRGYLNSEPNVADTVAELRAMGWRGGELGKWDGIGSKEVDFASMADENNGKVYFRGAFVRPLATVKEEKAVGASELDELNAKFGGLLRAQNGAPRGPVPTAADSAFADDPHGTEEMPF